MKDDEPLSRSSHKSRDVPLVELVHNLKVHVGSSQHLLVNQIQGSVGYELVEMSVIIFLDLPPGGGELYLEEWIIIVSNYDKIICPRHL